MTTKIIRGIDNQGRLSLGIGLIQMCDLEISKNVAICRLDQKRIMLRNTYDIKDCIVLQIAKIDSKGRICISKEITQQTKNFDIYALNGTLILEEAH